jgi:hypothetical protein
LAYAERTALRRDHEPIAQYTPNMPTCAHGVIGAQELGQREAAGGFFSLLNKVCDFAQCAERGPITS